MIIKPTYLLCILLPVLVLSSSVAYGQLRLTDDDKYYIKRLAELRVKDFEEMLKIISNPDISRGAVDRYINCSYQPDCGARVRISQIFKSNEVAVEDDVTPMALTPENVDVSAINLVDYLNKFKLQYKQGYEETVSFSDFEISEIQQRPDQSLYVVVDYTSEFRGKHNVKTSHRYKPVRRSATLEAVYDENKYRWQVLISGVNFTRTRPGTNSVVGVVKAKEQDNLVPGTRVDETRGTGENEPLNRIGSGDTQEAVADTESAVRNETLPLKFTNTLPATLKKGNSQEVRWNSPLEDAEIRIFKGSTMLTTLNKGLDGKQWTWQVKQKAGKDYSLMLYDPATNREVKSSAFQIKPRFPLALKIGIPASVVAGIVIWQLVKDDPTEPPLENIDWSPGLPDGGGN